MTETNETESVDRYRKNLSSILIDKEGQGPEITVGDYVLEFKPKAPVKTLAAFLDQGAKTNHIDAMIKYVEDLLVSDKAKFNELLELVDADGLSEILSAVTEAYTTFPSES